MTWLDFAIAVGLFVSAAVGTVFVIELFRAIAQ
jgi:hypothetical protein